MSSTPRAQPPCRVLHVGLVTCRCMTLYTFCACAATFATVATFAIINCAELEKQAINLSQKGGYRVLVPDLYKGKLGADKEEAHHVSDKSKPLSDQSPWHCAPLSKHDFRGQLRHVPRNIVFSLQQVCVSDC